MTQRGIAVATLIAGLCLLTGCAASHSTKRQQQHEPAPMTVRDLLEDARGSCENIADVRGRFSAIELQFLQYHIAEVEPYVNVRLLGCDPEAAAIAGYFRIQSSLPLLRHALLTDRYFYGWEGPDYDQESAYLWDGQYTHHLAYIEAIEAITCGRLDQAVELTPAEFEQLRVEANVDFAKRDSQPNWERRMCARWLLRKLTPTDGYIPMERLRETGVLGALGRPFGTIVTVSGRAIANPSHRKADDGYPVVLRITTVDGKPLPGPVDYPFMLAGSVDVRRPGVGEAFTLRGFETGGYDGVPSGFTATWQTAGFHFESAFLVLPAK